MNLKDENNYGLVSIDNSGQDFTGDEMYSKSSSNVVTHWTNWLEVGIIIILICFVGLNIRKC